MRQKADNSKSIFELQRHAEYAELIYESECLGLLNGER